METLDKLAKEGCSLVSSIFEVIDLDKQLYSIHELKDLLSKLYLGFQNYKISQSYWYEIDSLVYQLLSLSSLYKPILENYALLSLISSLLRVSEKCIQASKTLSEEDASIDSNAFSEYAYEDYL